MRLQTPRQARIDQRLSELKPSNADEALLVSVLRKQKSGPAPMLPAGAMLRIGRALGERPPSGGPLPIWRVLRTAAAVIAALVAVDAVAVVGSRVVEVYRAQLAKLALPREELRASGSSSVREPPSISRKAQTLGESSALPPLSKLPPVAPLVPSFVPSAAASTRERRALSELHTNAPRTGPAPTVSAPSVGIGPSMQAIQPLVTSQPPAVLSLPLAAPVHSLLRQPSAAPSPAPSASPPSAPAPDPLDAEAAQLERGLELKHAGNLTAAVAAFEHYRDAYPQGTFRVEAAIADLDAQLSLGHREAALSLLDQIGDDAALPRSAELRLLRAELWARKGRCSEALGGFEASLRIPSLAERALYGRAHCLQALGRFSESRSSYEAYLSRYPQGALTAEARHALGLSD